VSGSTPESAGQAEAEEVIAPVEHPLTRELDLHGFIPSEIGSLIPEYLELCRERGWLEVRLIHGRGTGQLRRSVEAILQRLDIVESFALAAPAYGGPGATWVRLKPKQLEVRLKS
jgi:DNA-nicking Smr family endonuclease